MESIENDMDIESGFIETQTQIQNLENLKLFLLRNSSKHFKNALLLSSADLPASYYLEILAKKHDVNIEYIQCEDVQNLVSGGASLSLGNLNSASDVQQEGAATTQNNNSSKNLPPLLSAMTSPNTWVALFLNLYTDVRELGILLPLLQEQRGLSFQNQFVAAREEFRLIFILPSNLSGLKSGNVALLSDETDGGANVPEFNDDTLSPVEALSRFASTYTKTIAAASNIGKSKVLSVLSEYVCNYYELKPLQFDEVRELLWPLLHDQENLVSRVLSTYELFNANSSNEVFKHFRLPLTKVIQWARRVSMFVLDPLQLSKDVNNYLTEKVRLSVLLEFYHTCLVEINDPELIKTVLSEVAKEFQLPSSSIACDFVLHRVPKLNIIRETARAKISIGDVHFESNLRVVDGKVEKFSRTNLSLQLLEMCAKSIQMNEPLLLTGETGTGKTTLIQYLAKLHNKSLTVVNLSVNSDYSDLMGGFRPKNPKPHTSKYTGLLEQFEALFQNQFKSSDKLSANNEKFLTYLRKCVQDKNWTKLLKGLKKGINLVIRQLKKADDSIKQWNHLMDVTNDLLDRTETSGGDNSLASKFHFQKGPLYSAIESGEWILLDEMNLAENEILQMLVGLLSRTSSTISEPNENRTVQLEDQTINIHPSFRLFGCMNPATDVGKRPLPDSLLSLFNELYVPEITNPSDLKLFVSQYFGGNNSSEKIQNLCVEVYLTSRRLAEECLQTYARNKPRYTLRTFCRSLSGAKELVESQKLQSKTALYESFQLILALTLDDVSRVKLVDYLKDKFKVPSVNRKPSRRPGKAESYKLLTNYWLRNQIQEARKGISNMAYIETNTDKLKKFINIPSANQNLNYLARAIICGDYPILLEGATSVGKTTMVEHLANLLNQKILRINNHEHTDVAEYIGQFVTKASDETNCDRKREIDIVFQEGLLVQALRNGYWILLDELNLAPTDVLEALNRLLDENRQIYVAETDELIKAHESFRLFATQNPSGVYGGRKPLSRAFRNRFVELYIPNIPGTEMVQLLEQRCRIAPKFSKLIVQTHTKLTLHRSQSQVFAADLWVTPRDLIKWGDRGRNASTKEELALMGYTLLAERQRTLGEQLVLKGILEDEFKVSIDPDWYISTSKPLLDSGSDFLREKSLAPTSTFLKTLSLLQTCIQHREPVLLIGDTGSGKTTVVQMLHSILNFESEFSSNLAKAIDLRASPSENSNKILNDLLIVNLHAHTESGDLLGAYRPLRKNVACQMDGLKKQVDNFSQFINANKVKISSLSVNIETIDNWLSYLSNISFSENKSELSKFREFVESLRPVACDDSAQTATEPAAKKTKLSDGSYKSNYTSTVANEFQSYVKRLIDLCDEISNPNFLEWVPGPLVQALKEGDFLLVDEINLADDAVIERLNPVLEAGGKLTLTEGSEEYPVIEAHHNFRIFATMNPGGDYGKRELSPALRSRFTEIHVPPPTTRDDWYLVLFNLLQCTLTEENNELITKLTENLLRYILWFNSSHPEVSLSLRDVKCWVDFISLYKNMEVDSPSKLTALYTYVVHGAGLMHLDGLGLGTTHASMLNGYEEEEDLATQCEDYLFALCPTEIQEKVRSNLRRREFRIVETNSCLQINEFSVKKLKKCSSEQHSLKKKTQTFSANKPPPFTLVPLTTRKNLFRLLRAQQLQGRPILLEGSPGIGKTRIIEHLANIVANRSVVRINLADGIDFVDLVGGDCPKTNNDGSGSKQQFEWVDGVLLKALKERSWILFDEMNLAPQSVLEGLNGLLDHRKCLYVPELDKNFYIDDDVMIFATQNPVAQGGGRKALPKSFLNRFTKVFMDEFHLDDLISIMCEGYKSRFSEMLQMEHCQIGVNDHDSHTTAINLIRRMVDYVRLLDSLCKQGAFGIKKSTNGAPEKYQDLGPIGFLGGPYEFNLRDLFRWSNLSIKNEELSKKFLSVRVIELVEVIFVMRFQSLQDRKKARYLCSKVFETEYPKQSYDVDLHLSDKSGNTLPQPIFQIGDCRFPVSSVDYSNQAEDYVAHLPVYQIPLLANILNLLHTNQTPLLISSHPETLDKLIKNLAMAIHYINGATGDILKQENFSFTPSTDETDLLGTFINTTTKAKSTTDENVQKQTLKFLPGPLLHSALAGNTILHLQNLNYSTGAVLDVMNPLLEMGGSDNLSTLLRGVRLEDLVDGYWCSEPTDDVDSMDIDKYENKSHVKNGNLSAERERRVKMGSNFFLLLSFNPKFGTISRAMRNRCVEVWVDGYLEDFCDFKKSECDVSVSLLEGKCSERLLLDTLNVDENLLSTTLADMTNWMKERKNNVKIESTAIHRVSKIPAATELIAALTLTHGIPSTLLALLMTDLHMTFTNESYHKSGSIPVVCDLEKLFNFGSSFSTILGNVSKREDLVLCLKRAIYLVYMVDIPHWQLERYLNEFDRNELGSGWNSITSSNESILLSSSFDQVIRWSPVDAYSSLRARFLIGLSDYLFDETLSCNLPIVVHIIDESNFKSDEGGACEQLVKMLVNENSTSPYKTRQSEILAILLTNFSKSMVGFVNQRSLAGKIDERLLEIIQDDDDVSSGRLDAIIFERIIKKSANLSKKKPLTVLCQILTQSYGKLQNFEFNRRHVDLVKLLHELLRSIQSFLCIVSTLNYDPEHLAKFLECKDSFYRYMNSISGTLSRGSDMDRIHVYVMWLEKSFRALHTSYIFSEDRHIESCVNKCQFYFREVISAIMRFGDDSDHGDKLVLGGKSLAYKLPHPTVPRDATEGLIMLHLKQLASKLCVVSTNELSSSTVLLPLLTSQDVKQDLLHSLALTHVNICNIRNLHLSDDNGLSTSSTDLALKMKDHFQDRLVYVENEVKALEEVLFASSNSKWSLSVNELAQLNKKSNSVSRCQLRKKFQEQKATLEVEPILQYNLLVLGTSVVDSLMEYLLKSTKNTTSKTAELEIAEKVDYFLALALSSHTFDLGSLKFYLILSWLLKSSEQNNDVLSSLVPSLINSVLELNRLLITSGEEDFKDARSGVYDRNSLYLEFSKSNKNFSVTLENHRVRLLQSKLLLKRLFEIPSDVVSNFSLHDKSIEFQFYFMSLLQALNLDLSEISTLVGSKENLSDKCKSSRFVDLFEPCFLPAYEYHKAYFDGDIHPDMKRKQSALAEIHLGLLYFHLMLPASSIDPGYLPMLKFMNYREMKEYAGLKLRAKIWDQSIGKGRAVDFERAEEIESCAILLREVMVSFNKQEKQKAKIIARTEGAPDFKSLYYVLTKVGSSTLSVTNVLSLLQAINNMTDGTGARLFNFLSTVQSFLQHFQEVYEGYYEDLVVPLKNAIILIKNGLNILWDISCRSKLGLWFNQASEELASVYSLVQSYPMKLVSERDIKWLLQNNTNQLFESHIGHCRQRFLTQEDLSPSKKCATADDCRLSVALAFLHLLELHRRIGFKNCGKLPVDFFILQTILKLACVDNEKSEGDILELMDKLERRSDENEEAYEQRMYRQQFPDHNKDFNQILEKIENSDEMNTNELDEPDQKNAEDTVEALDLSQQTVKILSDLYLNVYGSGSIEVDDAFRLEVFETLYEAAANLQPLVESTLTLDHSSYIGAHAMGVVLSSECSRGVNSISKSSSPDFHLDPNPKETLKAASCIDQFIIRVEVLLSAFPDHSILTGLLQVASKIRLLDMKETAVGKMLSGVELLLRKSQDWEQHASVKVTIGQPLVAMSNLIAEWRKLELASWPTLLDSREKQHSERAIRYWSKLVFFVNSEEYIDATVTLDDPQNQRSRYNRYPSWLWENDEVTPFNAQLMISSQNSSDSIGDLLKVMDTFLLTSSVGQFSKRLAMMRAFANQIGLEHNISQDGHKDDSRAILGKVLHYLWKYYSYFVPVIDGFRSKHRAPIEKKLTDEVKLAKWDEQTYYALEESGEKSHRKLIRILREYDEVLETKVSIIIKEELVKGVRSSEDDQTQGASTDVPSDAVIFPLLQSNSTKENSKVKLAPSNIDSNFVSKMNNWNFGTSNYMSQLKRYSKKMIKLLHLDLNSISWANHGTEVVSDLSDNIFDRLEALRSKNVTKPMKQRALVDLCKALKANGLSNLKSAVPEELREKFHQMQIPSEALNLPNGLKEVYNSAESYYYKASIELDQLRNEITFIGSNYMSQREMSLMLGYCEHLQLIVSKQKCLVYAVSDVLSDMKEQVEPFVQGKEFSRNQNEVGQVLEVFISNLMHSHENMNQLVLLLKSMNPLCKSDSLSLSDALVITKQNSERLADVLESLKQKANMVALPGSISTLLQHGEFVINTIMQDVVNIKEKLDQEAPLNGNIFIPCISQLEATLDSAVLSDGFGKMQPNASVYLEELKSSLSSMIASSLVCAQGLSARQKDKLNAAHEDKSEELLTFLGSFDGMMNELFGMGLYKCKENLSQVIYNFKEISSKVDEDQWKEICASTIDAVSLLSMVSVGVEKRQADSLNFYRCSSKLLYVLIRIFRVLIAKGFCADDVEDGEGGEGGDISGMTFEDDVEGTGMGEGEGKNDVTDQIENEEQLLGLKGENDEKPSEDNNQELKKDEAESGMEMENNFSGSMFDVPEPDENDQKEGDNDDDQEELDREMGQGNDPKENVVDEKMWNESDDENEDIDEDNEKFEKDSKMKGDKLQDEMRTKEEEEEDGGGNQNQGDAGGEEEQEKDEKPKAHGDKDDELGEDKGEEDDDQDEKLNEDTEDKYEEKAGLDVRHDENGKGQEDDNDDQDGDEMDLDGLELDNNMDGDNMGEDDNEELAPENVNDILDTDQENDDPDADQSDDDDASDSPEDMDKADGMVNTAGGDNPDNTKQEEEEAKEEFNDEAAEANLDNAKAADQEAYGVSATDGKSSIKESNETEDNHDESNEGQEKDVQESANQNGAAERSEAGGLGGATMNEQSSDDNEAGRLNKNDFPNPFKDPGKADEFWHRKLNLQENSDSKDDTEDTSPKEIEPSQDNNNDPNATYEYSKKDEDFSTQVMGDTVEENEAMDIDKKKEIQQEEKTEEAAVDDENIEDSSDDLKRDLSASKSKDKSNQDETNNFESDIPEDDDGAVNNNLDEIVEPVEEKIEIPSDVEEEDADEESEEPDHPKVVTDMSQLTLQAHENDEFQRDNVDAMKNFEPTGKALSIMEARSRWADICMKTNNLSRMLSEKLRLVMEPLVASKLQGDYRTGKRINMKRVIPFIASDYRKDKIWLRRTKPAKRDYRVLLAIDDSESMKGSGAGELALAAMATLVNGMNQIEIGDIGVASFGEEMNLIHSFDQPWTSESGINVVQNFKFESQRTRTATCVESALNFLTEGEVTASLNNTRQLFFLISDGRIEQDNRSKLRTLNRELTEHGILLVLIIVEGEEEVSAASLDPSPVSKTLTKKKKDKLLNIKEVTFKDNMPVIKQFMEDYPFPYYIMLEEMSTLPEILGEALKQWFEAMSLQNRGNRN